MLVQVVSINTTVPLRDNFSFVDPSKILFVKNLSYNTTNDSLADAFDGCSSARVAMERDNPGRSRG